MVPGYLFQILLRRRSLTSASCDRKFGTWVLFFQASGGRIWYQGKVLSYQLDRNVLVLLCSYVLPARCIVCVDRRNGTRVPKQNRFRRADFSVWHPGAIQKGAPAVKNGTRVMSEFLRRSSTDDTRPAVCFSCFTAYGGIAMNIYAGS